MTTTGMKAVELDGKEYAINRVVNMDEFPASKAYTKQTLYVQGPRGCQAMLSQRASGSWWIMETGVSRAVAPRVREVKEVVFK
jgi:hypothetical protein